MAWNPGWQLPNPQANPFAAGGAAGYQPPAGAPAPAGQAAAAGAGGGLFAGVGAPAAAPAQVAYAFGLPAHQRQEVNWQRLGFNPAGFGAGQAPMHQGPLFGLQFGPAAGGAPAAAAGAGGGAAVVDIYAGRPHVGVVDLAADVSEIQSLGHPGHGVEMVNFHRERNDHKRVYTRNSFNRLPKNAVGRRVNPYTRAPIQPENVTFYRSRGGKSRRRRTRRHRK